jgi:SOS-response transcriptional repressor LexA
MAVPRADFRLSPLVTGPETGWDPALAARAERLRQTVKEAGGAKKVAPALGVSATTLYSYLRGESEIRLGDAVKLAEYAGVSLDWLATGVEPAEPGQPALQQLQVQKSENFSYPVVGLASCGLHAWFAEDHMSVDAELRLNDPEAFAVLAAGDSLRPEGVRQGYLCFCSPSASRKPGDIVFVERGDGTASLKRLVSEEADKIVVEGWLPPEDGRQSPYREEVKRSYLRRLVAVVYVKRKL